MSSNNISNMLKELYKAEEEINRMINMPNSVQNGFKEYGLINSQWLENYINYLKNPNRNQMQPILFNFENVFGKHELKDYSYIGDGMQFSFMVNFSFVTKKSMLLISEKCNNEEDKKAIKKYLDSIIIGGGCIIKRDYSGKAPFSHIIIYKENKNNNIDYIIKIKDQKRREEARDYILKNNIWNYIKKIGYKEEDEYKEITDDKNNIIGNIVRNGNPERIKELKRLEKDMIKKESLIKNNNIQIFQGSFNNQLPERNQNYSDINIFNHNINNIKNNLGININSNQINNYNNMNQINMNNFNNNNNNFNNKIQNNNSNFNQSFGNNQNNYLINNNNNFNIPFNQNNNFYNNNNFNNAIGNGFNNQINNFNNNVMFGNPKDQEKDNKISELLLSNKELNNRIIQLENELNLEKEKNKFSNNKINTLQNELNKYEKKYKEESDDNKILREKINSYKNIANNNSLITKFMEMMDDLKIKEKKLNEIKSQLNFDLAEGEKLMTVIFTSTKQDCLQSFICKNTDQFSRLESLLYQKEEYKEYEQIENYFLVGGRKIKRYETLEENGIKNNDIITLVKMVEE